MSKQLAGQLSQLISQVSTIVVGKRIQILCEGPSRTNEARLMGRSPGNKIVIFEGSPRHVGEVFDVQIERCRGFTLYGDPAVLVP